VARAATQQAARDAVPVAPLVLSMGEPAGIGPDVTLAAWAGRHGSGLPPFYCLADAGLLAERARKVGLDVPIEETTPAEAAAVFARALPVL